MSETVGGRIRKYRKAKRLTVRELAPIAGLKMNSLYLVERGQRGIAFTRLKRIARHLSVRVEVLLGIDPSGEPDGEE